MHFIPLYGFGERSLLPLLPPRAERAGERRFLYEYCPSLRLPPRSFLAGRERQIFRYFQSHVQVRLEKFFVTVPALLGLRMGWTCGSIAGPNTPSLHRTCSSSRSTSI